jgi:hypothetical protein
LIFPLSFSIFLLALVAAMHPRTQSWGRALLTVGWVTLIPFALTIGPALRAGCGDKSDGWMWLTTAGHSMVLFGLTWLLHRSVFSRFTPPPAWRRVVMALVVGLPWLVISNQTFFGNAQMACKPIHATHGAE